jgi:hypothetical protein
MRKHPVHGADSRQHPEPLVEAVLLAFATITRNGTGRAIPKGCVVTRFPCSAGCWESPTFWTP